MVSRGFLIKNERFLMIPWGILGPPISSGTPRWPFDFFSISNLQVDQVEGQPEDSAAVPGVWPHDMFGIPSNISKEFQKFKGTYNISYIYNISDIIYIFIIYIYYI
jgi:hypothetical protein